MGCGAQEGGYLAYLQVDVIVREAATSYDLLFRSEDRELDVLDFMMECDMGGDGERLDCHGDEVFADFEWKWEHD